MYVAEFFLASTADHRDHDKSLDALIYLLQIGQLFTIQD